MSVECWVTVEIQGGELRNTDNFLFGRWENYVSISLLEPTMPITTMWHNLRCLNIRRCKTYCLKIWRELKTDCKAGASELVKISYN